VAVSAEEEVRLLGEGEPQRGGAAGRPPGYAAQGEP
jgi:hypothetical protein